MRFRIGIAMLLGIWSCATSEVEKLPFFNTADFTPEWISHDSPQYDSIHTVPPFSFYDQDGDTVNEATIHGKIVVADFFFTICPGICPRLAKSMERIQTAFKDDGSIILLSHSVTPDIDSIPRLKAYANTHNVISGRWHLLTGNRTEIYTLARRGYFADDLVGLQKSENEFLHTENFILIDTHRRIRGVYNGTNPAEVDRLIEDIRILKLEKI